MVFIFVESLSARNDPLLNQVKTQADIAAFVLIWFWNIFDWKYFGVDSVDAELTIGFLDYVIWKLFVFNIEIIS